MNEDALKKYLKENLRPVPPQTLGEASRIWLKIDGRKSRFSLWWGMVPVAATIALTALVIQNQTLQNETRIEEDYLYQEWNAMMSEVNSDESELITTFEK